MADYPIYSTPKTVYVKGAPFDRSMGGHHQEGSWWKECQIRIDSQEGMSISGALYFECVSQAWDTYTGEPLSLTDTTILAGTAFWPWNPGASEYGKVDYDLVLHCYNDSGTDLGTVTPISRHVIYQVPSRWDLPDGKWYNWNGNASTCEPFMLRYASDKDGQLYNPINKADAYNSSGGKVNRFTYIDRSTPYVVRNYFKDDGWQSFSATLPDGTTKFGVSIKVYACNNFKKEWTLYDGSAEPIIIDTTSRIWRRPANQGWTRNVGIWYRKKNTSTWEKKYLYKRKANSSTWDRI